MSDRIIPHPTPTQDNLSTEERVLVELYRQLSEARRQALHELVKALVDYTR